MRLSRLKVARDAAADLYVEQKDRRLQKLADLAELNNEQGSHMQFLSPQQGDEASGPQTFCAKGEDLYIAQHHHLLACLESVTVSANQYPRRPNFFTYL